MALTAIIARSGADKSAILPAPVAVFAWAVVVELEDGRLAAQFGDRAQLRSYGMCRRGTSTGTL